MGQTKRKCTVYEIKLTEINVVNGVVAKFMYGACTVEVNNVKLTFAFPSENKRNRGKLQKEK